MRHEEILRHVSNSRESCEKRLRIVWFALRNFQVSVRGERGGGRRIEGKWLKRRLNAGRKWRSRHVDVGKRRRLERRQRTEQEVERRRPGPYARFSSRVDKGDRNRAPFWVKYIHRGEERGGKDCYIPPGSRRLSGEKCNRKWIPANSIGNSIETKGIG